MKQFEARVTRESKNKDSAEEQAKINKLSEEILEKEKEMMREFSDKDTRGE